MSYSIIHHVSFGRVTPATATACYLLLPLLYFSVPATTTQYSTAKANYSHVHYGVVVYRDKVVVQQYCM
jgi:hypothetical protein